MRWAIRLRATEARALRGLRLHPELKVCQRADTVWLQGWTLDAQLERSLRCLPAEARFRCDANGALYSPGGRLPVGELPTGPWEDLRALLPLAPQTVRGAAPLPERITLQLVPANGVSEASLLLTRFDAWRDWALCAPAVRLGGLEFAVNEDRDVLVRGLPLPPLRGRRFHAASNVAVPCGLTWSPPVAAPVVAELFDLLPGELLLLREARWDVMRESQFTRATRSAVRETVEDLARG